MPYIVVENMSQGVDRRRPIYASQQGSLWQGINGHLTRGGDFEKRKAFVSTYTLPSGTYGLHTLLGGVYVFGSGTDPGVPSGVNYQRLQHESGETMSAILWTTIFDGKIYAIAKYANNDIRHFYDGTIIADWYTDAEVLATGSFDITGGSSGNITSVTVNGIEVLNVSTAWTTSNTNTASLVATQINTYNSTPEYTASASGNTVTVIAAAGSGTSPNGFIVGTTVSGDVTTGNIVNMSGGAAAGSSRPGQVAEVVLPHNSKMYGLGSSLLYFSKIDDPTSLTFATDIGSGFINISNQDEGSTELTGIEVYQGNLAFFSRRTIQVWSVDADPASNQYLQTLRKTGTRSPGSVKAFGDVDVFYLDASGVRSLRARDSSSNAAVNDVGTLIDTLVLDWVDDMTVTEVENIRSIVEPEAKRYWLAFKQRIAVFSYFPGSKISGWTWYELGFDVDWFAEAYDNTGPFVRSGDTIYKYGGSDNATYDDSSVTCWLPFIDGKKPGHAKDWLSVDITAQGDWTIDLLTDPTDLNKAVECGNLNGYTLNEDTHGVIGHYNMVSPKLTHAASGAASISSVILYYAMAEEEGGG